MPPTPPHPPTPPQPTASDEPCPHCGMPHLADTETLHLMRCSACGFVTPRSRVPGQAGLPTTVADLGHLVPGYVLRERYRLVEVLGQGAHGVTFLAEHEFLKHPCVVKLLPRRSTVATDAGAERLVREARAGFRVNDPHVVRVLDCDVIEGLWYFVMEYVDGTDLGVLTEAGLTLTWQQAFRLACDVAAGLRAVHEAGLLHRDVKPANVLLGRDGRFRLGDLGVASLAETSPEEHTSTAVGTPPYAAPECLRPDGKPDERADLYSLGATLYHVVTGRPPYAGRGVFAALIDAQSRDPSWPEDAPNDVPAWFVSLILRLLAQEPERRFPSAKALCHHLRQPREEESGAAGRELQPRGLAVVPFENEGGEPGDEWLGYALADGLSRELARVPGTYVADQEQLLTLLHRPEVAANASPAERLLAAARLVGAATVITGRFRRSGSTLSVTAELHRHDQRDVVRIGPLESELTRLVELQADAFERVARALSLHVGGEELPLGGATVTVEAQEKLVRAKQAYTRGDYEAAARLAREASERNPDLIEALQYVAASCARLGRYEEAETLQRRIADLAEPRRDRRLLLEVKANLGVMYYLKGEYERSHDYLRQAAHLAEELGLETERAQIYNNAGFTLFRMGRAQDAEDAFRRSAEICKRFGALAALIGPYNGLGNVMLEQQRYLEARDFYRRALTFAQEISDQTNIGVAHMHLGRCAALEGRFQEAKNEFALALNALEDTSFWNVRARTYEYIAELNLKLGNYAEAVRCADKKIELARRHANRTMEAQAWRLRAEALHRMGRKADAEASLAAAESSGGNPHPPARAAGAEERTEKPGGDHQPA